MAVVELVVTKVAQRTGCGYLPGGIVSRRTMTVATARYELGLAVSNATCSVERISPGQIKLAIRIDGEWRWYFFGPSKFQPQAFLAEFLPPAMWLIQSDRRGADMCTPQAQIMAFPGARLPAAVYA